jgi:hypothetical protein
MIKLKIDIRNDRQLVLEFLRSGRKVLGRRFWRCRFNIALNSKNGENVAHDKSYPKSSSRLVRPEMSFVYQEMSFVYKRNHHSWHEGDSMANKLSSQIRR